VSKLAENGNMPEKTARFLLDKIALKAPTELSFSFYKN
jgi:hypothetical protein